MSRTLTAADRSALIRLASTLPVGSDDRKAILKGLSKTSRKGDERVPKNARALPRPSPLTKYRWERKPQFNRQAMKWVRETAFEVMGAAGVSREVIEEAVERAHDFAFRRPSKSGLSGEPNLVAWLKGDLRSQYLGGWRGTFPELLDYYIAGKGEQLGQIDYGAFRRAGHSRSWTSTS